MSKDVLLLCFIFTGPHICQTCSDHASNVYHRFGRRSNLILLGHLAQPSPSFYRELKSAIFASITRLLLASEPPVSKRSKTSEIFLNFVCNDDCTMPPQLCCSSAHAHLRTPVVFGQKTDENIRLIINYSAAHFSTVLKFGRLMQYETAETGHFQNSLPVKSKMADSG